MGFEVFLARINNRECAKKRGEYGRVDGRWRQETLDIEVKVSMKMEMKMKMAVSMVWCEEGDGGEWR